MTNPLRFQQTQSELLLSTHRSAQPQCTALRDDDVVTYCPSRILLYQCRFNMISGTRLSQCTGKAFFGHAIARVYEIYEAGRLRRRSESIIYHSSGVVAKVLNEFLWGVTQSLQ